MEIGLSKSRKLTIGKKRSTGSLTLMFMALPCLMLFVAFSYLPLLGWAYAFFDYNVGASLFQSDFAGLKYLHMAITEREVLNVIRNTLAISFLNLLFSVVPVAFAVMISEVKSKRYQKLIQTTTTLPNFISWILVYAFMYTIFSSEGALNRLIGIINPNAETLSLMSESDIAWFFQAFVHLWKTAGWNAIIYLAAITGIDQEQYEAAKVDGATRFQRIRYITIPGIAETYLVLLLLSVAAMLSNGFEQFYVFYNPMVADKLDVLDYYVYRVGIQQTNYSFATAIGMYKTLISIIMLFVCNSAAKKIRGSSLI